jgi:hypothetical protein
MQLLSCRNGIQSSGSLVIFWILILLYTLSNTYTLVIAYLQHFDARIEIEIFTIVTTILYLPIAFLQLIMTCFSKARNEEVKKVINNVKKYSSL